MAQYDFNQLERTATQLVKAGKIADAIKIYLFMADGDQSLDAGYLGEKLGICYEQLGDLHAAKFWYGRAVEENPQVRRRGTSIGAFEPSRHRALGVRRTLNGRCVVKVRQVRFAPIVVIAHQQAKGGGVSPVLQ